MPPLRTGWAILPVTAVLQLCNRTRVSSHDSAQEMDRANREDQSHTVALMFAIRSCLPDVHLPPAVFQGAAGGSFIGRRARVRRSFMCHARQPGDNVFPSGDHDMGREGIGVWMG